MIRLDFSLFSQLFRFGVVGLTAATLHFSVVVFLVQNHLAIPLVANAIGFFCGFQISYWGHRSWTFSDTQVHHSLAIPKLLTVQFFNFLANETLFYIFLLFHLPYYIALLIVLTVLPIFTFIASKVWVFE